MKPDKAKSRNCIAIIGLASILAIVFACYGYTQLRTNRVNMRDSIIASVDLGDLTRAKELCDKWIETAPNSADAYLMRGRVNEKMKQYKAAEADYEKSNKFILSSEAVDGLARVRESLNWTDNPYTDIIDTKFTGNPNDPFDKLSYAVRLLATDESEKAQEAYSELINKKQLLPASYLGRGIALRQLNKPHEAIADLDLAEKHLMAISKTGEWECAKLRVVNGAGQDTNLTRLDVIYAERANAHILLKQNKLALDDINKAITRRPFNNYIQLRAKLYKELGMTKEYATDMATLKRRYAKPKNKTIEHNQEELFYMISR